MSPTPVIDVFSGTGQLGSAVAEALNEATQPATFSDTCGPARKYLRHRFPEARVARDFRHQDVPEGSVVTIGVGGQDLSVARRHAAGLSRTARADDGFAVVALQAHLMLQRGLTAANAERNLR